MGRNQEDPLDVGDPAEQPIGPTSPIGVPLGYAVPVRTSAQMREAGGSAPYMRQPRYYDGDELLPSQWGPDKIADLQRQLVRAGLIRPGTRISVGVWDEASIDGYYKLLASANRNAVTWQGALNRILSQSQGTSEVDEFGNLIPVEETGAQQVPTRTTPPEELRSVFRSAVIDTLGQGWDENKINQMVSAYNQLEVQRQQEAYAAEGTSGNVVGVPSPEAYITEQATQANPGRAQAEKSLDYLGQFMSMIGRWGNG